MFSIITTGIVIGVLISAPMGPLGAMCILCIQRTLNKGRLNGIVTGLGATTSDLIYIILVAFSMTFIIDFVEANRSVIQIIGACVLLVLGFIIFRKKPPELTNSTIGTSNRNLISTYTSAFGLCISNPTIVIVLIALFAQFNFFTPNQSKVEMLIGLSSILVGAIMWWLFLTFIVGIFRAKFKTRGLRLLNLIAGGVLMILAIIGIVLGIFGLLKIKI